jgi:hypothetical protein
MVKLLHESKLVERFGDDTVSGGIRVRREGRWRKVEKEVQYIIIVLLDGVPASCGLRRRRRRHQEELFRLSA